MLLRIIAGLSLLMGFFLHAQESILLDSSPTTTQTQSPVKQVTSPTQPPLQAKPSSPSAKSAPKKAVSTARATRIASVKVAAGASGQQLIVSTSAEAGTPEIQSLSNPSRFVMDIPNATLAKNVKRNFSSDLGQVRLGVHGNSVRVVVDFGNRSVPSNQLLVKSNQVTVSFGAGNFQAVVTKPESDKKYASEEEIPKKISVTNIPDLGARDSQLISIELRDADIRNVLHFIGTTSGLNIVVSEKVKGKVSVKLNGVPWYDALNSVLQTKNLTFTEADGVIRVLTLDELQQTRVSQRSNGPYQNNDGPVITRLIPVNYGLAKDLSAQVKDILSPRGRVAFDERTNMVIVTDITESLDRAGSLIKSLDTQTPQILIEARMVEAELNFSRSLGIEWGGAVTRPIGAAGLAPKYAINLPASNATTALGIQLGTLTNWGVINARLSAAEQNGRVKTVSMPKIMTLDNKSARITQGYQIPVTFANATIVNTQFVYAALQLDVTPHVSSDGAIMMAIKMTNNDPDFAHLNAQGVPAIITKEANTELLVKDGDTAVIGGIYTRAQNNTVKQTPLLGSIPIIGLLFKSTEVSDSQREMMVFLTPRLVNRQSASKIESQIEEKTPGTFQP